VLFRARLPKEVVSFFVEFEVAVPPPDACRLVGVRATAKSLGQQGDHTMKKNYQTKTAAALTVPDSVAIAMTDLAEELREASPRSPWARACR